MRPEKPIVLDNNTQEPVEDTRPPAFDYTPLDAETAQQVQTSAQHIRLRVQRTLEDLLAVGRELLTVKNVLPHGRFGPWLRSEFGWTERTARNFMAVAQRFGDQVEMLADLRIEPTAAYLLAAPSAPEEASAIALERAQNGETITPTLARDILGSLRPKSVHSKREPPPLPDGKILGRLLETLESFRRLCDPQQFSVLARDVREFADALEEEQLRGQAN